MANQVPLKLVSGVFSRFATGETIATSYLGTGSPSASNVLLGSGAFGIVPLAGGGTNADLSATGGTGRFLKQTSVGNAVSVEALVTTDLGTGAASGATVLRGDLTWAAGVTGAWSVGDLLTLSAAGTTPGNFAAVCSQALGDLTLNAGTAKHIYFKSNNASYMVLDCTSSAAASLNLFGAVVLTNGSTSPSASSTYLTLQGSNLTLNASTGNLIIFTTGNTQYAYIGASGFLLPNIQTLNSSYVGIGNLGSGSMFLNTTGAGVLNIYNAGTLGVQLNTGIAFNAAGTSNGALAQMYADGAGGNIYRQVPTGKTFIDQINTVTVTTKSSTALTLASGVSLVQTGQGGGGCVLVQPVAGGAVSSRPLVPAETATPLISAALWQPNGQVSLVATVAVANNPYIFLDPRERFAYVFNGGTSSNLVCRIMPDGTLFTISTAVTTSGPTFSNSGKFVYLGNSSYLLDPVSGAYTSGVGPTGTFSESFIVFDPYDRFAWSTNNGTSLYSATVNPLTGALTQSGSTITAAGTQFAWMAVDPSGRYLYVTDALNAYLYAYSINQTTGALTSLSGSPYTLTASSKSVDVDPSGNFVFVNYASAAQVQAFKITPSTGALAAAAGGAVTGPTSAAKLICDRSGKFLFVAGSSQLYCYSYDGAGLLTLIGSQVLVGSPNFIDLKITASNRYLYVANYANASYQIFALQRKGVTDIDTSMSSGNVKMISGHTYVGPLLPQDLPKTPVASLPGATSTGALSTITAAISSPNYPQNPATDRSGSYLYVAGFGSSNIAMYSINQTTGALTALTTPTVSTVSGPVGTCFAKTPFGSFVYVGSNTAASISGYSQDPATGQLTAISGSPFTDLAVVTMIYVDATSRFLYAVHGYSSTGITVYAINQTTGALTYIATTPVLSGYSYSISGDPTGQFIFYTTSSLLVGFTVNQATGNLTLVNSVTVGTVSGASYSSGMVCTAKGYIYTHSKDSNLVYVSSFNPLTGTLTLLSSQAYTGNLLTWTASPDGNFVYAGDYANALYTGWRVGSSGALTALATIAGGSNPNGVVVDPSGRFLYGANYAATGTISQYSVNSSLTLPSNINYAATPQSFIARSALAASANAVVAVIPSTAYAEIKIIDNKSNIVYYGLYAGTLTQITTNASYSVTSTPGAAAFGLAYASGAVSIYAGSGATSYSWAAFVSVTT